MRALLLLSLAVLTGPANAIAAAPSPYAGQEGRAIKALSPHEIEDLRAGRGMGLAKVAELNSYPGPAHVLELAEELRLTTAQQRIVEARREHMSAEARRLGAAILEEERTLDTAFATSRITPDDLRERTLRIGELQGRLRASHLAAHLDVRAALAPDQIAAYDRLRGYNARDHDRPGGHAGGHGRYGE